MKITTFPNTLGNAHMEIDCKDSTAVKQIAIIMHKTISPRSLGEWVCITWANGDRWGYFIPIDTLLPLFGEESVGRFANAIKRGATWSDKIPTLG